MSVIWDTRGGGNCPKLSCPLSSRQPRIPDFRSDIFLKKAFPIFPTAIVGQGRWYWMNGWYYFCCKEFVCVSDQVWSRLSIMPQLITGIHYNLLYLLLLTRICKYRYSIYSNQDLASCQTIATLLSTLYSRVKGLYPECSTITWSNWTPTSTHITLVTNPTLF